MRIRDIPDEYVKWFMEKEMDEVVSLVTSWKCENMNDFCRAAQRNWKMPVKQGRILIILAVAEGRLKTDTMERIYLNDVPHPHMPPTIADFLGKDGGKNGERERHQAG